MTAKHYFIIIGIVIVALVAFSLALDRANLFNFARRSIVEDQNRILSDLQKARDSLESQISDLKKENSRLQREIDTLRADRKRLNDAIKRIDDKLSSLPPPESIDDIRRRLEDRGFSPVLR